MRVHDGLVPFGINAVREEQHVGDHARVVREHVLVSLGEAGLRELLHEPHQIGTGADDRVGEHLVRKVPVVHADFALPRKHLVRGGIDLLGYPPHGRQDVVRGGLAREKALELRDVDLRGLLHKYVEIDVAERLQPDHLGLHPGLDLLWIRQGVDFPDARHLPVHVIARHFAERGLVLRLGLQRLLAFDDIIQQGVPGLFQVDEYHCVAVEHGLREVQPRGEVFLDPLFKIAADPLAFDKGLQDVIDAAGVLREHPVHILARLRRVEVVDDLGMAR